MSTIDTLSQNLINEGFEVITASSKTNQILRLLDMLVCIIKNRNIDFLLIDTYSTSAFWYAFLTSQLARVLRIKYIPILHGGNLPSRIQKSSFFSKLIFKNAYCNVAPSNYLKYEFERAGYDKIMHISNTIELINYPYKERKELQPKLLWVRAFATIYNPKMAIEVLHKLKENYPEAELCMVGPDKDGSLVETRNYAKALNLNVTFTGGLSKKDWISLSHKYDIFINTTHFDNTPVSLMEAMALGLPIVTTNVGGIPYLIEDKKEALLINDDDPNAMVQKIEFLLQNKDQTVEMIQNARTNVEQFDWQQVKKKWINLLE